jgi:hypothetical protein
VHNIKPTKMNYIKSKHWVGQKWLLYLVIEVKKMSGVRMKSMRGRDWDSHCCLMVGEGG